MGLKADSEAKFDEGKINKVLALIVDMNDMDLGILIDRLRKEQVRRNEVKGENLDTIQT
jgi:hypothetical protein